MMGRVAALYTVIDDTFDAYGTIEELELFATAIERFISTYISLCLSNFELRPYVPPATFSFTYDVQC